MFRQTGGNADERRRPPSRTATTGGSPTASDARRRSLSEQNAAIGDRIRSGGTRDVGAAAATARITCCGQVYKQQEMPPTVRTHRSYSDPTLNGENEKQLREIEEKRKKLKKKEEKEKKKNEEPKGILRRPSISSEESLERTPSRTSIRASIGKLVDKWREKLISLNCDRHIRSLVKYLRNEKIAKKAARVQEEMLSNCLNPRQTARKGILLKSCKFTEKFLEKMLKLVQHIVLDDDMLVEVTGDVIVVADIHGQLDDLLRIFENFGTPKEQVYVFLGDYVDRGPFGVECFMLLVAYKLLHPFNIVLLRGNHECEKLNRRYGFYDECRFKYSRHLYTKFRAVFNSLPVCAIVNKRVFCCHGGIGPELDLEYLNAIERPVDALEEPQLIDLMWADPRDVDSWENNDQRETSCYFGYNPLCEFLERYGLDVLVRGHEPCLWGFEFLWGNRLVTIFSASNYMINATTGRFEGYGAVLKVDEIEEGSVRVCFNLAPGESFPLDCPSTGGGRRGGSSIAGLSLDHLVHRSLEEEEEVVTSPLHNEQTNWGRVRVQSNACQDHPNDCSHDIASFVRPNPPFYTHNEDSRPEYATQMGPGEMEMGGQGPQPNLQFPDQRGVFCRQLLHQTPPQFAAATGPNRMPFPPQQFHPQAPPNVYSEEQMATREQTQWQQSSPNNMPPQRFERLPPAPASFGHQLPPAATGNQFPPANQRQHRRCNSTNSYQQQPYRFSASENQQSQEYFSRPPMAQRQQQYPPAYYPVEGSSTANAATTPPAAANDMQRVSDSNVPVYSAAPSTCQYEAKSFESLETDHFKCNNAAEVNAYPIGPAPSADTTGHIGRPISNTAVQMEIYCTLPRSPSGRSKSTVPKAAPSHDKAVTAHRPTLV